MATTEMEKIRKAKIVMEKIANGVNPVTGDDIVGDHFLHDPRMIDVFSLSVRCLMMSPKVNMLKVAASATL